MERWVRTYVQTLDQEPAGNHSNPTATQPVEDPSNRELELVLGDLRFRLSALAALSSFLHAVVHLGIDVLVSILHQEYLYML